MKRTLPLIFVLSISACGGGTALGEAGFAPCPNSPNCVSSLAGKDDTEHYIPPFQYGPRSRQEAEDALTRILSEMKRARPVEKEGDYIHYVFISRFMRFRDDVEFLFSSEAEDSDDSKNGLIHIRSASRLGYSDMGVNRRRMEEIRSAWQKELDLKN